MGKICFTISQPELLHPAAVERAYLAGLPDWLPWQSQNELENDVLTLDRSVDDSGCLYFLWHVEGHGLVTLMTSSLMEREQPYDLGVELARGTVNRLRNQFATWTANGFAPSPALAQGVHTTSEHFIDTILQPPGSPECEAAVERTLKSALTSINRMVEEYCGQVFARRHQQYPKLNTLLSTSIELTPFDDQQTAVTKDAFNSVFVPFTWREIEVEEGEFDWSKLDAQFAWAQSQNLRVCSGPLIQLDRLHLPDWLYLWDDFETIQSFVLQFTEQAIKRYAGQVHIWQCAAGMNIESDFKLSEEDRLRLTLEVILLIRNHDPGKPIIVTVDQPWAEYLCHREFDLSPIHFADTLVRAEVGIAGIGLEINMPFSPSGTLPRDILEVNRQIELWERLLNLPLLVMLTVPSDAADDPMAAPSESSISEAFAGGLTPANQSAMVQRLATLLISKPSICGFVWNQLRDSEPHRYPYAGLFDANGKPKPAVDVLTRIRNDHLA